MKILLDQGLPRGARRILVASGIDAEHVADIGLANSDDAMILEEARKRHACLVTLDADFHRLLAFSHATEPSVIRVRIEGLKSDALGTLVTDVVARCAQELRVGAVITVDVARIRMRKLPLP